MAVVAHGYVRFTADLDLVLAMDDDNLRRSLEVFSSLGFRPRAPVPIEQFADPETRATWVKQKGMTVFSLWNPKSPLTEVDLFVENPFEDFSRAYSNALHMEISPGITAAVVGLENLIALKKNAGRSQDLLDVDNLKHLMKK